MPLTKSKTIGIIVALIVIAGAGMFWFGQEVMGQEAVVVELTVNADPVTSSPLRDVSISVEVEAYRSRVSASAIRRGYDVAEISGDKLTEFPGATVEFLKNVTISNNATGEILYQHVLSFTNIADRKITYNLPTDGIESGTVLKIVVDIWIRIELPTPPVPPAPQTIEQEVTEVVYATVQE